MLHIFHLIIPYLILLAGFTMARIAAYMKTNIATAFIHENFLENASNYLACLFNTDIQVGLHFLSKAKTKYICDFNFTICLSVTMLENETSIFYFTLDVNMQFFRLCSIFLCTVLQRIIYPNLKYAHK